MVFVDAMFEGKLNMEKLLKDMAKSITKWLLNSQIQKSLKAFDGFDLSKFSFGFVAGYKCKSKLLWPISAWASTWRSLAGGVQFFAKAAWLARQLFSACQAVVWVSWVRLV